MQISVLLVGIGGYGAHYARQLLDGVPGAVFAGAVDPYAKLSPVYDELIRRGIPVYDTVREFFDAGHTATAAIAPVPIALHPDYAAELLGRGLDLLLEKPVCATMEQARGILAAAKESRGRLAIGFQWCSDSAMRAFRADAVGGVYGRPMRLKSLTLWPRDRAYYARGTGWAGKKFDPMGRAVNDSIAMNACAHYLYNMLWVADSPAVSCECETARAYPVDTYDTCAMRFTLQNGAQALFLASHITQDRQEPMLEYEFENAVACFGGRGIDRGIDGTDLVVRDKAGRLIKNYGPCYPQSVEKLTRFIEALQTGRDFDCPPESALMHLAAIEMAEKVCPEAFVFPENVIREKDGFLSVPGLTQGIRDCYTRFAMPRERGGWTDEAHTHHRFAWHDRAALEKEAALIGARLPLAQGTRLLASPCEAPLSIPNRLCVQPMEGADSTPDSSPSELTRRRYLRFAEGGAGLIWFESVAVSPDMRSSPHQLALTRENLPGYARLLDDMREAALRRNGCAPRMILQLNLSGRYSRPYGTPRPRIAYHNPILEPDRLPDEAVVSDDELRRYEDMTALAARMAQEAGFDGADVKCCHGYLASELLSAYDREGEYGGSFENRSRFLLNSVRKCVQNTDRFVIATRMSAHDNFAFPYGYGVKPCQGIEPDWMEAQALARALYGAGERLVNVTCGNPYRNPHVNRPYDAGNYVPEEHPLTGVSRLMDAARAIKQAVPGLTVTASGFTYLHELAPLLAEGMLEEGSCDIAGFGRMAFAYPDFARDILNGSFDRKRVCAACGACAKLLRAGEPSGCVVRDRDIYRPLA